jgi:CubicO group peptidase (beta-lactamase class C family)
MVRYVNFLVGEPARASAHAMVLKRESLEEMFAPAIGRSATNPDERSGLIFFLERLEGRNLVGHTGSQNGFHSNLWFDPVARTASLVVANTPATTPDNGHDVDRQIHEHLVRHVYPAVESQP